MKKRYGWIGLVMLALGACEHMPEHRPAPSPVALIPAPAFVERQSGSFEVSQGELLQVAAGDERALAIARRFAELMQRSRGIRFDVRASTGEPGDGIIEFVIADSGGADALQREEGYELTVAPRRVKLVAQTPHGLFNGSTTLWQLLTADAANASPLRLEAMHIVDHPRFAWRGLLLDSARHFQPPEFVKRFIDAMALHKLDVLHWHLTDDQGWRIEIKRYPKLTQIGAWRDPHPDEAALVDPAGGKYGGFYTQEQIRDIVRYAADRYVTVVPEIDMPGHAQAAIAAYPQLGVTGAQPPVSAQWGINTYLYNVEESTFGFIDDVLGEVLELFPSPYIHVGGDEAAKDQWQASARVHERMRELGVADEPALQGYFTARLDTFLRGRGRRLVGWDEILEGGLPAGAVVMSWRGTAGAVAAAGQGDDVIMSPDPVMYLDHLQSTASGEPPGRVKPLTLADVYAFEPVPPELDADQARHVLGAQANLWSEYFTTPERVEYAAFPRAAALAERLWSPPGSADWGSFVARLPAQLQRYRTLGIGYGDSAVAPQITLSADADGSVHAAIEQQVALGSIRYTLDGSTPGANSPVYRTALNPQPGSTLNAATFAGAAQISAVGSERADASHVRRRYSDRLGTCGDSLLLRVEGAATKDAAAPRYNVDLMNPCWIYRQVDFDTTRHIDIRAGALPYFFELWHDANKVVRHAPSGAADELQVYVDSCDGPLLGAVTLSADRIDARNFSIDAGPQRGVHDICVYFAQHGRDPLRLIDWIEPIPASH